MNEQFNANFAKLFGVEMAILIHKIKEMTHKELINKNNIHNQLCWIPHIKYSFNAIFPYWTTDKIEKLLSDCEKIGLIVKGKFTDPRISLAPIQGLALTAESYCVFREITQDNEFYFLYESISEGDL